MKSLTDRIQFFAGLGPIRQPGNGVTPPPLHLSLAAPIKLEPNFSTLPPEIVANMRPHPPSSFSPPSSLSPSPPLLTVKSVMPLLPTVPVPVRVPNFFGR
jgi:hypothetical protein